MLICDSICLNVVWLTKFIELKVIPGLLYMSIDFLENLVKFKLGNMIQPN